MARPKIKEEFILNDNKYYKLSNYQIDDNYNVEFWNIDETISELAYLTHDYFRYYGKFPSKVGKNIIADLLTSEAINKDTDFIFDNYEGSGTSLVEAKLAGFDSVGIDINPFAVLASRVKTYNLNIDTLRNRWEYFSNILSTYINYYNNTNVLQNIEVDPVVLDKITKIEKDVYIQFGDVTKWFDENIIKDLAIIKTLLLELDYDRYREFFSLAFFAIIRRVSKAHDGEVRPHVNLKKRKRQVLEAYMKKVNEMVRTMNEWNRATDNTIYSESYLSSNTDEDSINTILNETKNHLGKNLGLVISHPPYLNCFDYIPIYKLKFQWAHGFKEIFGVLDLNQIKNNELKSYPVNNHKIVDQYFENNRKVYEIAYNNLRNDGYCCVVIGDCTVKKQLFSIHKGFIKLMEEIGFTVEKICYRSTHYGLGKYAYDFRADYHLEDEGKKDAIIYFKK
jgi:hypothetical protein